MCCLINSFILNSKPPVSAKVIYEKYFIIIRKTVLFMELCVTLSSPVVGISFSEQIVKMIVELIELKLIT